MIIEIAVGTLGGILAAAIVMLAAYHWYRLATAPEGWPKARNYLTIFVSIVALLVLSWFMVPIVREQYAESQRQKAIARKEAIEREHCKSNWSLIIARAVLPDTSPLGPFGRPGGGRDEYEQITTGWGTHRDLSAHGWLMLCKRYGIVPQDDFDRAIALQKKNQEAHDAPELARRKEATDKLTKLLRGE